MKESQYNIYFGIEWFTVGITLPLNYFHTDITSLVIISIIPHECEETWIPKNLCKWWCDVGSVTLLHYSTTLLVIISIIPHKCEDSDEVELACGPCNKCTKKAQNMQSKYFPELQMKKGTIKRITTPSFLNKPFFSLMYDFLMVVFLWDVSSFSPQFSDWAEGNPGYFSNLFHPLIRKCSKVQTRTSTKGQKTRNKTEDRPAAASK